jgi:hypothetical protein
MSPLDHCNLVLLIEERKPISCVVNNEPKHTESFWNPEFVRIRVQVSLQRHPVIWVQHHKLELDVVCDEWCPLTFSLLLQFDVEFNVVLQLVVLGIRAVFTILAFFATFVVSQVGSTQDAGLLEYPIEEFFAEPVISRCVDCLVIMVDGKKH